MKPDNDNGDNYDQTEPATAGGSQPAARRELIAYYRVSQHQRSVSAAPLDRTLVLQLKTD